MALRSVRLRPLEEEDIDYRYAMYQDQYVRENIVPLNYQMTQDELRRRDTQIIAEGQKRKIFFVAETGHGKPIGYIWALPVDWQGRTAEVALAIDPRYRLGYGAMALLRMMEYLFEDLGFHTVVHQIYDGNSFMQSADLTRRFAQLIQREEVWSGGRYRNSYLWSETYEEFLYLRDQLFREMTGEDAGGGQAVTGGGGL